MHSQLYNGEGLISNINDVSNLTVMMVIRIPTNLIIQVHKLVPRLLHKGVTPTTPCSHSGLVHNHETVQRAIGLYL